MARLFSLSLQMKKLCLLKWTFAFLLLGVMSAGCTPKKESAKFRIEIPQALTASASNGESLESLAAVAERDLEHLKSQQTASQNTFVPGVIVVNVRYTLTGPVRQQFHWQNPCMSDHEKPCAASFPNPVALEVESGPQRLIQVMVMYFNESRKMRFLYGDLTKDLSPGANEVVIRAALFGNPEGSDEIEIAGRYVGLVNQTYPSGVGPTGSMTMMFQPPNGRPMMDILKAEIFNGYFNVMAIEEVPTVYRLDATGEILFKDLTSSKLTAQLGNHLLKVQTPSSYYRNFNPDIPEFEPEEGSEIFVGFFGPGVSSLNSPTVCYPSDDGLSIPYSYLSESTSDPMLWYGTTANTSHATRIGGGRAIGTGPCEGEEMTPLKLYYDPMTIAEGKDSISGVRGPFLRKGQDFPSWGDHCDRKEYAVSCYDEAVDEFEFRWAYVPGIFSGPGAISGVTLFTKIVSADLDSDTLRYEGLRDGYRCSEFASSGFKAAHFTSVGQTSYRQAFELQAGTQIFAVLCPFKLVDGLRTYFDTGIRFHDLGYSNSGGGGGFLTPPSPFAMHDFSSTLASGFTLSRSTNAYARNVSGGLTFESVGVPRFEYRQGMPVGLWLEPEATNVLLYSSNMDQTSHWTTVSVVVEPDVSGIGSPIGDFSVERIKDTGSASDGPDYLEQAFSGLFGGMEYTFSVYLKMDTSPSTVVWLEEIGQQSVAVEVNLSTSDIAIQNELSNVTDFAHGIEDLGDGWRRVWISTLVMMGNDVKARIVPQLNGGFGQAQNDSLLNGSVFAWGAQLETGLGPTSYIETAIAQTSRAADQLTIQTPATMGIDLQWGTLVVEFELPYSRGGIPQSLLNLTMSTMPESESITLYYSDESPGAIRSGIQVNSNTNSMPAMSWVGDYITTPNIQKVAISLDGASNTLIFSHGGSQVQIDLSNALPAYDLVEVGQKNGMDLMTGWIRKFVIYQEALTAEQLNSITNPMSPHFSSF